MFITVFPVKTDLLPHTETKNLFAKGYSGGHVKSQTFKGLTTLLQIYGHLQHLHVRLPLPDHHPSHHPARPPPQWVEGQDEEDHREKSPCIRSLHPALLTAHVLHYFFSRWIQVHPDRLSNRCYNVNRRFCVPTFFIVLY